MKKTISLILVLSLVFLIGSFTFATADTDIEVTDPALPGSPVQTVTGDMYDEEIEDDDLPGGSDSSANVIDIVDEEPPKAEALPKTGGIPAETFYAAGALLIVAALVISFRKSPAK